MDALCMARTLRCGLALAALLCLPLPAPAQPASGGKIESMSVRVGDADRSYLRYVPAKVAAGQPLVIVLHGTFMTGDGMRYATERGFEKLADEQGFVVAYPDASELAWNDCRKLNNTLARVRNIDDVAFLRSVIAGAAADHGSDRAKVYLFGFSGGGHMAYRMASEAPAEIAAIATVAANLPPPDAVSCAPSTPTPRTLLIKGMADSGDPYDGGPHPLSGTVLSARASVAMLAAQNGLGQPEAEVTAAPGLKLQTWNKGGRPVVALYSVEGLPHMVPVAWRDKVDGVALAWKFFTAP